MLGRLKLLYGAGGGSGGTSGRTGQLLSSRSSHHRDSSSRLVLMLLRNNHHHHHYNDRAGVALVCNNSTHHHQYQNNPQYQQQQYQEQQQHYQHQQRRFFRASTVQFNAADSSTEEAAKTAAVAAAAAVIAQQKAQKAQWRAAALDYNNRRAAYHRSVRQVRKLYALEIAQETETARLAKESAQQMLTRQRLERQRVKNIKNAQQAIRLVQFQKDRAIEFQHHLQQQQVIRQAKHQRYQAVRQYVIDQILEPEAPLWLTTMEDITKAFTHENMQLLWGRPGGVLGATNPTLDAKFWEYQAHTWHMNKTYKSPAQILLEDLEQEVYDQANIDPMIWTAYRQAQYDNRQRKAKLRSLIHAAGRSALIRRQQHMLEEQYETSLQQSNYLPQPKPVPSLELLSDNTAIEQEGMQLALDKPTDFFQFDQSMASGRGVPVDLVDPLRKDYPNIFPLVVGRAPPPDTRTEKEKKQDLRELEKKWAVAAAVTDADDDDDMDDENDPDALDYENFAGIQDDEDFQAGRYSEDEIEWVTEKLAAKLHHYQQEFAQDLDSARQDLKSQIASSANSSSGSDASLEAALLKLTDDELIQLSDLDDQYSSMTPAQAKAAMAEIRFLSPDHILQLVTRDRTADLEED